MKKIALLLAALVLAVAADLSPQEKYIRTYSQIAVSEMARTGVPASITLAQGLLESRYGLSPLASEANNHFGVKCHRDWPGDRYYMDDDEANECFRAYPDAVQSFRDHSDFLRYQDRYKSLFDLKPTDYKAWAKGLRKAGYATDPSYAQKLIRLIEEYELYKFDRKDEVIAMIPEAPNDIEKAEQVPSSAAQSAEMIRFSLTRPVYEKNGILCVIALEGDSYETLADANGLFLKEILRFNDASGMKAPKAGEIVYLQNKKNHAAKGMDKYIVGADGESLRDISQRFGVRMSSIMKLNKFTAGHVTAEGDTIKLRK